LIGARGSAQAQVDAPGIERLERAELFGDDQGRVVGQHDPACPDTDCARAPSDIADHHGGRGAGDANHVVVFSEPVAVKAPLLRVLGQIKGSTERLSGCIALGNGREIEDGDGRHSPALQGAWAEPTTS